MHSLAHRLARIAASLSFVAFLACGGPQQESESKGPAETVSEHMKDHFSRVKDVQEAVIKGDLEAVKGPAQWVAEHQAAEGLPEGWEPHVTDMKNAARHIVEAADVATAAAATATIARTCGECHAATGTKPQLVVASPPPEDTGTVPHMIGHMWAADRMWEGLIVDSDEAWANGVGVLAGAPLHPEDVSEDAEKKDELDQLAKQVHELASKGRETDGLEGRAELYGQFLATCAKCHQMLGEGGPR